MMTTNFLSICKQIGKDITAIQGAGGNISIKNGDTMFIKASGLCLCNALEKDIFTQVSITKTIDEINNNSENFTPINPNDLRPSIETPLHALISFPVVLHVHCVHTIVHSILENAPQNLRIVLKDFLWSYIPYARPGIPLAHLIQKEVQNYPKNDIFILQNHGLIIAGNDIDEVYKKLEEVRKVLHIKARAFKDYEEDFLKAKNDISWEIPQNPLLHSLASDEINLKYATQGVLYPDHVVFLGTKIPLAKENETCSEAHARLCLECDRDIQFMLYPNKGILISPHNSSGQNALIYALALVCSKIEVGKNIHTLSQEDINNLTHWDAEKYRQSLEEKR